MLVAFGLLLPVFLIIAAGYWLRQTKFLPDSFWAASEKLGYWVLLPALVIQAIATRDLSGDSTTPYIAALVVAVLLFSALVLGVGLLLRTPGTSLGSVHQGSIRLNGLAAIAAGVALIGPETIPIVALMFAVWIPLSNGLSVYGYVLLASKEPLRPCGIALEVLKNPAIFSVIVGFGLNIVGAGPLLEQFMLLELVGRAALPMGLLAGGAALDLRAALAASARVVTATGLKLVAMPLAMIGLVYYLELDPLFGAVAIICASMPTSPGGYLVAKHLGGDAPLMASIVTLQTALSLVTVTVFASYALGLLQPI